MSVDVFFSNVQSLAAFVGALTTIGGFLIIIYKYVIQKPYEKRKQREDNERNRILQKELQRNNAPFLETLNQINESLEERERHDGKLDEISEQNKQILQNHENRLDNHNERLIILEVKNGVRKQVTSIEDERR